VLETGVKLMRAALRVYAFQGFSAAALLIIYWRILINYAVIRPVYFYPLVTAVAMAGLTLGCVFFRRVTEKTGNSYLTLATFQILAGLTAVISYLAVYVLLQKFHELLNGTLAFSKMVANHLLLFTTLIILPAVLTGATIPLAGKLFSKKLEKTGSSFGRLGFIWFFSALTGIMLTTYIMIPVCGLYYAYFIIVFFLMSSGIYLILRDSRLIRGFRMSYAVMAVLIYFLIIGLIKTFHVDLPRSVSKSKSQVITRLEGSTASLNTIVDAGGNITVMLNNKPVMASDNHGLKTQLIPAYLPLIMSSHIDSALITGFGMGLTAAALESNGVSTIHITEMHPEIIRLSADVFADMNDDILTSSHVNTTIEDARSFLIRSQRKLDLITTGFEHHILDPQYYTREFYRLCHEKLSDTGLLCQIVPVSGISYNEFRALIRACSDVFREVSLWYLAPEKMLMMGEKTSEKHDFCRIFSRLGDLNLKNDLSSIGIPDAESLLAHLLVDNSQIRRFVDNAPLNLDNRPIIQYSRYTEKDTDKSILMFLNDSRVNYPEFLSTSIGCVPDYAGIQEKADLIIEGLKLRPGEPSNFR
jgi:spermidine synthase